MNGLKILKTSRFLPEKIIKNKDFTKYFETSDEWISSRTGIKTRHFTQTQNAQMALKVAEKLMENEEKDNICGVIIATFTPDYVTPSVACTVCKHLGIDALAFDFNSACSGFVYGLHIAKGILMQNPTKKIILIGSEKISSHINFQDRASAILFGDGAGGVMLSLENNSKDHFLFGTTGDDETILCKYNDKIYLDGKNVFLFATQTIEKSIIKILENANLKIDDIDHFVFHQANLRIISHVAKKLKITKYHTNIDKYGNTSSASIPILLDELNCDNKLKQGDKILFVGFGAGLTYGASIITF